MAIEHACAMALPRPWGVIDLAGWAEQRNDGIAIGEIRYERQGHATTVTSLLLKLLLTSEPLSIQVHPDDAYAQSIGLANGKTEAWYVLSTTPGARIALGLKQRTTAEHLRQAAGNGSIQDLVAWQPVSANDVIFVPAGTIHAIGAGIVIAEIQQRSDATFRLYDHGRDRELHIERGVAAANPGSALPQERSQCLSPERTLLVSGPHFVFERIDLAPDTTWRLAAERETWLLVVSGHARAGSFDLAMGEAIFAQDDSVPLRAGPAGMSCLVAYTGVGGPVGALLQRVSQADAGPPPAVFAQVT